MEIESLWTVRKKGVAEGDDMASSLGMKTPALSLPWLERQGQGTLIEYYCGKRGAAVC